MTFSIAPKDSLDNKAFENLTDPSKASEAVIFHLIVLSYIINLHIPKITQNNIKIAFIHFLLANTTKL